MELSTANVATILVLLLAAVGAVVVITNPDTLSFQDYLEQMKVLVGGLAVGRGIAAAGRSN
jgi:hypothetical protein